MKTAFIVTALLLLPFLFCELLLRRGKNYKPLPALQFLGSLKMAVILLILISIIMAFATFIEAKHGAETVRLMVYNSPWFASFIALIWLNIFVATILRLPIKSIKPGFFMTHFGILVLIAGSLITRLKGVEGTMTILEGEKSSSITLPGNVVNIKAANGAEAVIDIEEISRGRKNPHKMSFDGFNSQVRLIQYLPHSHIDFNYKKITDEKSRESKKNPEISALKFRLSAPGGAVEEWLATENPALSNPEHFSMGSFNFLLKRLQSKEKLDNFLSSDEEQNLFTKGVLKISFDEGKNFEIIEIARCFQNDYPLASENLKLRITRLFQNVVVEEGGMLRERGGEGSNPAIAFVLTDAEGKEKSSGIRFQKMPFYQGKHGEDGKEPYIVIEGLEDFQSSGPNIEFAVFADKFYYKNPFDTKNHSGELQEKQNFNLSGSSLNFQVLEIIPEARIERLVHYVQPDQQAEFLKPSVQLQFSTGSAESEIITLLYNEKQEFEFNNQIFSLHFTEKQIKLPFQIHLHKFRKIDYPNTNRAMSYESDVTVEDLEPEPGHDKARFATTISMNNVLDHRGWRFFQSSFRFVDENLAYSTFQVAGDPGIETVYTGSIIMMLGFVVLFWLERKKTQL
jgi:hypothetical protein